MRRNPATPSRIHAHVPAPNRHIIIDGMSIGLPHSEQELLTEFDTNKDFSYCKLCGWAYQGALTRSADAATPQSPRFLDAVNDRRIAANNHYSLAHSEAERQAYESSGLFLCPEAAIKLAPLGIIDLTGIVRTPEVRQAYAEASRTHTDAQIAG